MAKKVRELVIEFPDDWARLGFALWFSNSGEQHFWECVDMAAEEDGRQPVRLRHNYHRKPDGVFCGHEHNGDGPNDVEPKTIQVRVR